MVDRKRFEPIIIALETSINPLSTDQIVEHTPYDKLTTESYLKYLEKEGIVKQGKHNFTTVWKLVEDNPRDEL